MSKQDRYSTDSDSITDSFVVAVGVLYMNITTSTGFFSMMICRSYGVILDIQYPSSGIGFVWYEWPSNYAEDSLAINLLTTMSSMQDVELGCYLDFKEGRGTLHI
ncbi:hypothetical protein P8452_67160 [Trifolium repens]|nr:hypothetical protein P8452_67160 [Trifolium repens]